MSGGDLLLLALLGLAAFALVVAGFGRRVLGRGDLAA